MIQGYISGRVKVGIAFHESTTELANQMFREKYNYDIPEDLNGLLILSIDESCDIANTDLQLYDFIVSTEGVDVSDYDSFISAISEKKADDIVHAKVVRLDENENRTEFDIEFKLMPDTTGHY